MLLGGTIGLRLGDPSYLILSFCVTLSIKRRLAHGAWGKLWTILKMSHCLVMPSI